MATAGSLTQQQMFTVDGLFYACRLEDGPALEVIPLRQLSLS